MTITTAHITDYASYLHGEERAAATIAKYARDIRAFAVYLGGSPVTKESAIAYKAQISGTHAPASVNSMLAAINGFFAYHSVGVKIKPVKTQRRAFLSAERELTRPEYLRLLAAAKSKENERLNLVMQTICSTGIRVSELRFFTVAAAKSGVAEVTNKGKTRTVFIPERLTAALLRYCKKRGICSGCIFISRNGKPLDRSNIWAAMKKLCDDAGIAHSKVFPHSLRALFARTFYAVDKDIAKLADILGHSSIDTTRGYVKENSGEHRRRIEILRLVT
ncbi:MAG: tyrosine-type recombinase/integrase [Oscillospiraceae bacterium]|jgi:site-specific recombinase XerD|nr:tyrosine-type recombinase/integrase [Oscillospiraceae bacterium]